MQQFLAMLGMMSIQSSIVILVVLGLRKVFEKLHIAKKYTMLLWMVPFFCLIFPWKISVPNGFWHAAPIEQYSENIPETQDISVQETGGENRAETEVYSEWESVLGENPGMDTRVRDEQKQPVSVVTVLGFFWLTGVVALLVINIVRYVNLKRRLLCNMKTDENVYKGDDIVMPMVVGILRPRIYIPTGLPEEYEKYVLAHEKTHIRRLDTRTKLCVYVITCIHWFNPLVWLSFYLFCKDMEMTCDEETIKHLETKERKSYAEALLGMASGAVMKNRLLFVAPVTFEEGDVKSRIKNIIGYKKTMTIVAVAAIVVCIVVAGVFMTKGAAGSGDKKDMEDLESNSEEVLESNMETMYYFETTDDKMEKYRVYQEFEEQYDSYKKLKDYRAKVGRDYVNKLTVMRSYFRNYYEHILEDITAGVGAESDKVELEQAISSLEQLQEELKDDVTQMDVERYRYNKEIEVLVEQYSHYLDNYQVALDGETVKGAPEAVNAYRENNHDITDEFYTTYLTYVGAAIRDTFQSVTPADLDLPKYMTEVNYTDDLGYCITDLDSDGVKELLIGKKGAYNYAEIQFQTGEKHTPIYGIYSIQKGKMVKVLDGSRNNYFYLCEDGIIGNRAMSYVQAKRAAFYHFENGKPEFIEAIFYDAMKNYSDPFFYSDKKDTLEDATAISEQKALEINNHYKKMDITFKPLVAY